MMSEDLPGVLNIEKGEMVGHKCVTKEDCGSQKQFHKTFHIREILTAP